jgi:hypothetical protein
MLYGFKIFLYLAPYTKAEMKKLYSIFIVLLLCLTARPASAKEYPDTVLTGMYITSIHDIDFRQKEYSVNLWLWLKYKNRKLDFVQNLEIPQAKTFTKSFTTIDTSNGMVYLVMKLQCVMKDSWKINSFPFDRQRLRLAIENSQFDADEMVFMADTSGKHFDSRFTLNGWRVDSFTMNVGNKVYETAFGDPEQETPKSEYSSLKVRMIITRDAMGIFWKMFLGMYVAFLIAFVCFFIHADSIDARFGLAVGALFAVIGNKYIIDSSLPETTSFTLVDSLHGITLFFIFLVISQAVYALTLVKRGELKRANRYDKIAAIVIFVLYTVINILFIYDAART